MKSNYGYKKPHFKIKIQGNNLKGYSDHAMIIENLFVHEYQHYSDYLIMGYVAFYTQAKTDKTVLERNAIKAQMTHPTYINLQQTGVHGTYRQDVIDYGKMNNMMFPLQRIEIKSISK